MNRKVQVLRGFAICAVVIIHSYPHGIRGIFIRPPVNFAVAMFLFLSGWLTGTEPRPFRHYARRIGRILVPYVLWSVIYTAVNGTWTSFWPDLLTGNAEIQLYYVLVYIQFMLLTPLLGALLRSRYRRAVWWITPVSLAAVRYLPALMGTATSFPFPSANALVWCTFYALGMALGGGVVKAELPRNRGLIVYALTLGLGVAEGLFWFRRGNYDMATGQLRFSSLLSSVTVLLLSQGFLTDPTRRIRPEWLEKTLVFLGDCSSGIFFAHRLVTWGLRALLHAWPLFRFPVTSTLQILISALCVFAAGKLLGKRRKWVLGI